MTLCSQRIFDASKFLRPCHLNICPLVLKYYFSPLATLGLIIGTVASVSLALMHHLSLVT